MSSNSLIICDPEEGYAQALAYYLMHKKEFSVEVQVYDEIEKVQEIAERTNIKILFVASEYEAKERRKVQAERKILLTGSENSEVQNDETALYKYQSGDKIVKLILESLEVPGEGNFLLGEKGGKQPAKIIGVYSPIHRIGKTSYALKLGEELAVGSNVLYLNLELYGGVGGHFAGDGQNLSDLLYYAKQEKGKLGLFLTTIVQHRRHLDYVLPMEVAEDVKMVSASEWIELIKKIIEQSIYQTIILDIDEGLSQVYKLLQICTEIHVPEIKDRYAQAKIRQFEQELTLLGYEDVLQKIKRKDVHDRGRTAARANLRETGSDERGRRR